jgi:hypothetical protein
MARTKVAADRKPGESKWQTEGRRMLEADELERQARNLRPPRPKPAQKKKPARVRAYKAVSSKHSGLAAALYLVVGLFTLIGKAGKGSAIGLKWSGVGVGRTSRYTYRRLVTRAVVDIHRRKWVPEAPAVDGQRRPREHYRCCGEQFTTTQSLNRHLLAAHRGEKRQTTANPLPELQVGVTTKTAGKVLVLPAGQNGGRHRRSHQVPGARRVEDLVTAYRGSIDKIGARIVALNDTTGQLKRAAAQFGQTPKPKTLADLRNVCVGMEQAMGALRDAIGEFGMLLKRPGAPGDKGGGANIEPTLVNQYFGRAQEHVDATGLEFTKFIAAFEAFYAMQIRMAGGQVPVPAMDLSKTG